MIKTLFALLIAALMPIQDEPTADWKAEVVKTDGSAYQLVLTGDIVPGSYTHPMSDPATANELVVNENDRVKVTGNPIEEYTTTDYKGEKVVEGRYVVRQNLELLGEGSVTVSGVMTWNTCSGNNCNFPEDYEFSVDVDLAVSSPVVSSVSPVSAESESLMSLIIQAILWGFMMLLTPCVFPMVPMTVSFFMKGSENPAQGRVKAGMYGLFIVLLYTLPICIIIGITWLVGGSAVTADIFNWLSTHWLPNIIFFVIFMIFAASFFGAFEIVLPSKWTNSADKNSDRKGLAGVFFLSLTLVLVSFSCTGPIVGTVLIKSTHGEFWAPMVTMLAFSVAFALPFTLLAFFPSVMKKLPKSGGWLNSVKVVLGFIELALGFKFLSTADQTYHWHLLDREVYLAIWIVCFSLLGFYLLGKIRFKHDSEMKYLSVKRLVLVIADFAFVVYMIPGMWGAPLKALSGYLPPLETQDFVLGQYNSQHSAASESEAASGTIKMPHGLVAYGTIDQACRVAAQQGKKVFVDFTGFGCVNCREMEARVWSDPNVLRILKEDFVIVSLFVDDKTKLPESEWVTLPNGKVLKDVGRVNSNIAVQDFGVNAQPNYFILDSDGSRIAGPYPYNLDIEAFKAFLTSYSSSSL